MDPLFCNETTRFGSILSITTADCAGYDGDNNNDNDDGNETATTRADDQDDGEGDAEVTCSCCTHCCNDQTGCPIFDVENGSCELHNSLIQNEFISCECVYDSELILAPLIEEETPSGGGIIIGEYLIGTTLVCEYRPIYQSCNVARTDCAFYTWGREYSNTNKGDAIGEWERYEYNSGAYAGEVLTFSTTYETSICQVDVDNTVCNYCTNIQCDDLFSTYYIQCDNIHQDGSAFNGCDDTTASATSDASNSGILQVLHPEHSLVVYNPGYCDYLATAIQDAIDGFVCTCSSDGLGFSCKQQSCHYCFNRTSTSTKHNATDDGPITVLEDGADEYDDIGLCYLYTESYKFLFGEFSAYTTTKTYEITKSPTSSSSRFSDVDDIGRIITVNENVPTDEYCSVSIDDEVCNDCKIITCTQDSIDGTGSSTTRYQVDCSNVIYGVPTTSDVCSTNETIWSYETVGILQVLEVIITPECVELFGNATAMKNATTNGTTSLGA